MNGRRSGGVSGRAFLGLALGLVPVWFAPGRAAAQQTNLDPYKPYSRSYQPFADPVATFKPGFPNPLGGSGRPVYGGTFNPNDLGYGGFEPFAPPYFNRGNGVNNRMFQDLERRPDAPIDPQEKADREFYGQMQKREESFSKLQQKRDQLYFDALQEPDLKKRAELLREYQRATFRLSQAYGSQRRGVGGAAASLRGRPATPAPGSPSARGNAVGAAGATSSTPRRTPGTAPATTPRPAATPPR